ncbi:MAG: hypothetical protein K1X28_09820 [Parachlamydiales bacterium]|nr:hypothetical protein [Parachlamydiales bacterium]
MNAIDRLGREQQPFPALPAEERTLIQRICDVIAQAIAAIVSFLNSLCCRRPLSASPVEQEAPPPEIRQFSYPRGHRFRGQLRLLNEGEAQPIANYRGSGNFENLWGREAIESIALKAFICLKAVHYINIARTIDLSIDSYAEHFIDELLLFGAQHFYNNQGQPLHIHHERMDPAPQIQTLVELAQAENAHAIGAILQIGQAYHTLYIDMDQQRFYHFNPQEIPARLRICGSIETFMEHLQPIMQGGEPFALHPYRQIN